MMHHNRGQLQRAARHLAGMNCHFYVSEIGPG